jgi:predicted Na+-dependent transporter
MDNTPKHNRVEDLQSTDDVRSIPTSDTIQQAELLATVSGLVFGFLTSIAVTYEFPSMIGRVLVAIALLLIATAIGIFLLPLLYTQLNFPMDKQKKVQFHVWSRKFILCGLVPFILGNYCAVWLALSRLIEWFAPIVATVIVIVPLTIYRLRRIGDQTELA